MGRSQDRSASGRLRPHSLPERWSQETQPGEVAGEKGGGRAASTALDAQLGRAVAPAGRQVCSRSGIHCPKPASPGRKLRGGPSGTAGFWRLQSVLSSLELLHAL